MSPLPRDRPRLVLTCEHASNAVPPELSSLFAAEPAVLDSHRGHDLGARGLMHALAGQLEAPTFEGEWTRLVVDLNRSERHPGLFSSLTKCLSVSARLALVERYHRPYRTAVRHLIEATTAGGPPILHLSVHSFTPIWDGAVRTTGIGLLYDPSRPPERAFAGGLQRELRRLLPGWTIHRNQPYRGASDGLTSWLRRLVSPDRYLGVELEVNQGRIEELPVPRLVAALTLALETFPRDESARR